jgi:hypothetical protein
MDRQNWHLLQPDVVVDMTQEKVQGQVYQKSRTRAEDSIVQFVEAKHARCVPQDQICLARPSPQQAHCWCARDSGTALGIS